MIIACLTDRRFTQFAGVLLASLFDKGEIGDSRVIVFGLGLRAADKARVRASCGAFSHRPEFVDIDLMTPVLRRLLPTRWSLGPANYARLLLPELVSGSGDRFLYLDCDMLVMSSLQPLIHADLQGNPLAAVREPDQSLHPAADGRLPHPAEIPYFNAGMLLIDLAEWRRLRLTDVTFDFIERHQERLRFAEQDALNCVLAGRWTELDPSWNFTHVRVRNAGDSCAGARIIHFTGGKPTARDSKHPARDIFLHYRAATPWRYHRLTTRFERRLQKSIHKRVARLKAWWVKKSTLSAGGRGRHDTAQS